VLGSALLAALGIVLEVLIAEKHLLGSREDEIRSAFKARQNPVGEHHDCSPHRNGLTMAQTPLHDAQRLQRMKLL
jgi:hypothetical protein